MGDDDDDLIDDAERAKSIVFKFGESKIAIPMPYGFGFFPGLGSTLRKQ